MPCKSAWRCGPEIRHRTVLFLLGWLHLFYAELPTGLDKDCRFFIDEKERGDLQTQTFRKQSLLNGLSPSALLLFSFLVVFWGFWGVLFLWFLVVFFVVLLFPCLC